MSVEIEIDELVFEGLDAAEARRAARALEETLAELLEQRGLPGGTRAAELGEVTLGELPAQARTPEGLGRALARALYDRVAQ
ncbi:MAG: hypothetical protein ACQEUZ_02160 [Pseudomonadota bacterium]